MNGFSWKFKVYAAQQHFHHPFTVNFERYVIDQERNGWKMLAFEGGAKGFKFYFGEVCEGMMGSDSLDKVVVAPWQILLFNRVCRGVYGKDQLVILPRLLAEYVDIFELGDPVEFVDLIDHCIIGSAIVTSVSKLYIRDIPVHLFPYIPYHVTSHGDIVRYLSEMYEQGGVTEDTVISLVAFKVTSLELNFNHN